MRFMFQYPETNGTSTDMLDAGDIGLVARAAEDAGFMGFSFTEHPAPGARWLEAGGHQTLDPFAALAFVAAVTSRMRLLTYLSVMPYRNPLLLAKTAATVDRLSGGRFVLGVGAGYLKAEFRSLGVDFDERNHLFDEALDVLPLHWSGEPFSYQGRHFEAREVMARPRPAQERIPIWIGGNSQLARQRVAERADGWMPLLAPAAARSTVRSPPLGSLDDVARAIREMQDTAGRRGVRLDVVYPYADRSFHADPGNEVSRHQEALAGLAEAGVTWTMVSGKTNTPAETLSFLEAVGTHYITASR
jgi:probable F420-dependent oxidoreductase